VKAYAVVQLRQDNRLGTLFNMVAFNEAQAGGRCYLPHHSGLAQAEFARLGGLHRNTFLNAPNCSTYAAAPCHAAAALCRQITGCEAMWSRLRWGLAGRFAAADAWESARDARRPPPRRTLGHITGVMWKHRRGPRSYQPMNVNFGLSPLAHRRPNRGRRAVAWHAKILAKSRRSAPARRHLDPMPASLLCRAE